MVTLGNVPSVSGNHATASLTPFVSPSQATRVMRLLSRSMGGSGRCRSGDKCQVSGARQQPTTGREPRKAGCRGYRTPAWTRADGGHERGGLERVGRLSLQSPRVESRSGHFLSVTLRNVHDFTVFQFLHV